MGLTLQQKWSTYLQAWKKSSEAAEWGEQNFKTNHRWSLLALCLGEAIERGEEPTRDNWIRVLSTATARVIDYEAAAVAQQQTAEATAKETPVLRHEDVPELRAIRCKRDIKNLSVAQMRGLLQRHGKKYEERIAEILAANIVKSDTKETVIFPIDDGSPLRGRANQTSSEDGTMAIIDSLHPRDFHNSSSFIAVNRGTGEVTDSGSKFSRCDKAKGELRELVYSLRREGVDEIRIRETLHARIDEMTSSSIR